MPSKTKDSAKKKAPPVAAAATGSEPDWKEIAITLWRDVNFAAANLKGSGILYNPETGTSRHWKERFADSLELMPGVTVDRDAMHAMDLPKKQRLKFFKDREDAKTRSARTPNLMDTPTMKPESPTDAPGVFHAGSGSVALVHQFQPTPYTCVHACLAMVLGKPVEEVIEEIGLPHGLNQHDLLNALEKYDVMHAMTLFGALWSGWQFATVPSLNVRGGTHKVLVHWEAGKYRVLDPSPKIRYKEDGSDLGSWNDVILVRPPNV